MFCQKPLKLQYFWEGSGGEAWGLVSSKQLRKAVGEQLLSCSGEWLWRQWDCGCTKRRQINRLLQKRWIRNSQSSRMICVGTERAHLESRTNIKRQRRRGLNLANWVKGGVALIVARLIRWLGGVLLQRVGASHQSHDMLIHRIVGPKEEFVLVTARSVSGCSLGLDAKTACVCW